MNRLLTLAGLILGAALLCSRPVHAANSNGPYGFAFTTNTTVALPIPSGLNSCTIETYSTSSFGGGAITMETAGNIVPNPVTGVPDLGNTAGYSQTLNAPSQSYTISVTAKRQLLLVMAGASSPNVTGSVYCDVGQVNPGNQNSNVTNSAPGAPTPGTYVGVQRLMLGNGTTIYADTWPDQWPAGIAIATAETIQVIPAASSGQATFMFGVWVQVTSSSNVGLVDLVYGTGTNCGTIVHDYYPGHNINTGSAGGQINSLVGGSTIASAQGGYVLSTIPTIVPPGEEVCVVATGATVALEATSAYSQHAVP